MNKALLKISIVFISLFVSCKINNPSIDSNSKENGIQKDNPSLSNNKKIEYPEISLNAKKNTTNTEYGDDKIETKFTTDISLKLMLTEEGLIVYEGEKDKGSEASTKLFKIEKNEFENFKDAIENPNYQQFSIVDLVNSDDNKSTKIEVSGQNGNYIFLVYKIKEKSPVYAYEKENNERLKKWISDNIKT